MRSSTSFPAFMAWGVLLSSLLFASGCEKKLPQYPEDHARFERIVQAIQDLQEGYTEQDPEALREIMLPLDGLERLQGEMQNDFSTYAEIELEFTIERMAIKGGRATVNVRWEGHWRVQSEDAEIIEKGHGVIIWSGRQVILLADVDGDLPFGMATRQSLS